MVFLNFFDFITNSLMMSIVALATCIIVGYVVKVRFVLDEVKTEGNEFRMKTAYSYLVRYVCPICMTLILIRTFSVFWYI